MEDTWALLPPLGFSILLPKSSGPDLLSSAYDCLEATLLFEPLAPLLLSLFSIILIADDSYAGFPFSLIIALYSLRVKQTNVIFL